MTFCPDHEPHMEWKLGSQQSSAVPLHRSSFRVRWVAARFRWTLSKDRDLGHQFCASLAPDASGAAAGHASLLRALVRSISGVCSHDSPTLLRLEKSQPLLNAAPAEYNVSHLSFLCTSIHVEVSRHRRSLWGGSLQEVHVWDHAKCLGSPCTSSC